MPRRTGPTPAPPAAGEKNETQHKDFTPQEVQEICDGIESIMSSSLTCECGTNAKEAPGILAIVCKGPDNFKQSMAYGSDGQIIMTDTCMEYTQETKGRHNSKDEEHLVCIKESYFDTKGKGNAPSMCEASFDGERCPFCMPMSRMTHTVHTSSAECKDGLSLRCGDSGYDTLCTLPDGTRQMTQFTTERQYGSGSMTSDPVVLTLSVLVVFALLVAQVLERACKRESRNEGRADYGEVELHGENVPDIA